MTFDDLNKAARSPLTLVARQVYAAGGSTDQMVQTLVSQITVDPALVSEAIEVAAYYKLNGAKGFTRICATNQNAAAQRKTNDPARETLDDIADSVDLISGVKAGDFPLWNGTKLRDATLREVRQQAEKYLSDETKAHTNRRYMERILERAVSHADGTIVGTLFTDDDLSNLRSLTGESATSQKAA